MENTEVGPSAQKGELAGVGVALIGRTAKCVGQLVDLVGFEAGQHAQVLDYTGRWVGSAEH